MFAFLKSRYGFALIPGLALVLLIFYFTVGRNRKTQPEPLLPESSGSNNASKSPATRHRTTSHSASYSVSLDSDNDGIPDTAELPSFMDRENFRRWFTLIGEG